MVDKTKRFTFVLISILFIFMLVFVMACDNRDEKEGENGSQGGDSTSSNGGGVSGGSDADQSISDDYTGPIGTRETEGSRGSESIDAGSNQKIAGQGEVCFISVSFSTVSVPEELLPLSRNPLGMFGICKHSSDPCEGGTAEVLSAMGYPQQTDAGGDCLPGLVCCTGTDQCKSMGTTFLEEGESALQIPMLTEPNMTLGEWMESIGLSYSMDISCASDCAGEISFAMGCPTGNTCCMDWSYDYKGDGGFFFLLPDAGGV